LRDSARTERDSRKKGMWMNHGRFAKRAVAAAGFLFLCWVPGLTRTQGTPPPAQTPPMAPPPARPKRATAPTDDFAGLNFTDDQKARINKIHEDFKVRLDTVIKDDKLSPDQKRAMLQGFQHMERGEVYKVLTREQQVEVRKRILARRAATQKEQQEKNGQAPPTQPVPTQQPPQSSKPPQPPSAS
jgi:hypothetical protein